MSDVRLTYWPTTKVQLEPVESQTEDATIAASPVKFDISSLGLVKRDTQLTDVSKSWSKVPL